jgi:hypothetical protein
MVALQERLLERDGVQLDQGNHDLFPNRRIQGLPSVSVHFSDGKMN